MKKVIIAELFDEIEELNTSLRELTDFELADCRQSLIQRTNILMSLLDELSATWNSVISTIQKSKQFVYH